MRNSFSRLMQESIRHQQEHSDNPHLYWYTIDPKKLSTELIDNFIHSNQDTETQQFLDNCFTKSDYLFTQIYHGIAKSILKWFMSTTSANGWLDRGSMFVFSTTQFRTLLDLPDDSSGGILLDLGAGDGKVTQKMAPMFKEIYVTEISPVMCGRLQQLSYTVIGINDWETLDVSYDVISCLNLLDRCDKPITMLEVMRKKLRPNTGLLVLALVFPMKQYVEVNPDNKASESLFPSLTSGYRIEPGASLEEDISNFTLGVLAPAGFDVVRWTRLPYLCEGDLASSFYSLNDIVFVLKPSEQVCFASGSGDTCS